MSNMTETNSPQSDSPMTLSDWLVTILITMIPIVGIIMFFVWAFSSNTNPSKKTWAQATLILVLITTLLFMLFGGAIMASLSSGYYY